MPPRTRPLTDQERSALLRFEALYEDWRVALEALSESERRLWTATLNAKDGHECERLGAETIRLRVIARDAYATLITLLQEGG